MDYTINNLAPDADVIHLSFGDHPDSMITVTISREEDGSVSVLMVDNLDGSETRMFLGQEGLTQKV
jgi:hypothetical protein